MSVSHTIIPNYEMQRRTPNLDLLVKITAHFNVSIDYLPGLDKGRISIWTA